MSLCRVILAEKQSLVRAGLCVLLERISGIHVVGLAADGHEALTLIRRHKPDVVLLDAELPKLRSLDVSAQVCIECPATSILMLAQQANASSVAHALTKGVTGYLLKDVSVSELEKAVSMTASGKRYLSPKLPHEQINEALTSQRHQSPQEGTCTIAGHRSGQTKKNNFHPLPMGEPVTTKSRPLSCLTPRQREVLQLIVEGYTTRQIAGLLNVSFKTAETHRTKLMQRLDIHDVASLVRYAMSNGVLTAIPA